MLLLCQECPELDANLWQFVEARSRRGDMWVDDGQLDGSAPASQDGGTNLASDDLLPPDVDLDKAQDLVDDIVRASPELNATKGILKVHSPVKVTPSRKGPAGGGLKKTISAPTLTPAQSPQPVGFR